MLPSSKYILRDALLRGDDVVHAVRENFHVLQFRPQHFVGEHGVRMIEHAAKERVDEARVDAIAQPAGQNFLAVVLEVLALFQIMIGDQEFRVAFLRRHAAPDFRHEQADVVIHAHFRADITGGGHETVVAGQHHETSALFRSMIGGSALNGPLVSAPSEPAPVVDGDLPVMLQMNSMNSSGSSK